MNTFSYLIKLLYRKRYWLIFSPLVAALIVYGFTKNLTKNYRVESTIYTGVVSGYDIETGDGSTNQDWNKINNAMDNLAEIMVSQTTLKRVSMRLFAEHLMYGDVNKDNTYIMASHYKDLIAHTPPDVLNLVDRNSEDSTLANLYRYEKAVRGNHVYGLFNYEHKYYSYKALKNIVVKRVGNSDMISTSYISDDPGVAYNTLRILNEEFVNQYKELRFGETNNVIAYFEAELARVGAELRVNEDSLTHYNISKGVINYEEQTKQIAALSRDFELTYESILLDYNSAKELIDALETRIDDQVKNLKTNAMFIQDMDDISKLSTQIAIADIYQIDTLSNTVSTGDLQMQLENKKNDLVGLTDALGTQYYSKEGIATSTIVEQWLDALIRYEQANAKLVVMKQRKGDLDAQYGYYSPIGSTLKRKEREINFSEQTYLSVLHSLNTARLKQKNLQMSSATLKVINPPEFPIASEPTKRKLIVSIAFFGVLFFLLGVYLIADLLDRKLRNKFKVAKITGADAIGAIPAPAGSFYHPYDGKRKQIAAKYLANAMMDRLEDKKSNVINILSTDNGVGKSYVAELLSNYFYNSGLSVICLSYHKDFDATLRGFMFGDKISDFLNSKESLDDKDVIIVEYPPIRDCVIPKPLLQNASYNLMIARADRIWRDSDQLLFDKLVRNIGKNAVSFCLNMAKPEAVETFTGQLPPTTWWRRISYKVYQQGYTPYMKEEDAE